MIIQTPKTSLPIPLSKKEAPGRVAAFIRSSVPGLCGGVIVVLYGHWGRPKTNLEMYLAMGVVGLSVHGLLWLGRLLKSRAARAGAGEAAQQ